MWSTSVGDGRSAGVVVTDRRHGDFAIAQPRSVLEARQRAVVDAPWSWLHQVHGSHVVNVTVPGEHAGADGDALCTELSGAPVAVQVADCAPVALIGARGVVGVAHAGWRGLVADVIAGLASQMTALDAGSLVAVLGPCIHPSAYEFGAEDLAVVEARFGPGVRGRTTSGGLALDMPATVRLALDELDVPLVHRIGGCTAAEADRRWSHRARNDPQRQAMVVWMEGL